MTTHLSRALADAEASEALGGALAAGAAPGQVLFLSGELGAGKTTVVRGLLRALGHRGRVKSPSYALLEPYRLSSLDLYHFDFYRFQDRAEWLSSGFRDCFSPDSLCLVEWPERLAEVLPAPDLWLRLAYDGAGRLATLQAHSPAGRRWLGSV